MQVSSSLGGLEPPYRTQPSGQRVREISLTNEERKHTVIKEVPNEESPKQFNTPSKALQKGLVKPGNSASQSAKKGKGG